MKHLFLIVLILLTPNTLANPITEPVLSLFDAMREHDSNKLILQFTDSAVLQRAKNDDSIETSDIRKFADNIGKSTRYLDEHLLDIKINVQDNLASVWTPYVFYLDNKLSHCGVNSFQLVRVESNWKIHYLIDNSYQGDCEAFIKKYTLPPVKL